MAQSVHRVVRIEIQVDRFCPRLSNFVVRFDEQDRVRRPISNGLKTCAFFLAVHHSTLTHERLINSSVGMGAVGATIDFRHLIEQFDVVWTVPWLVHVELIGDDTALNEANDV